MMRRSVFLRRFIGSCLLAALLAAMTAVACGDEMTVDRYGRDALASLPEGERLLWGYDRIVEGTAAFDEVIVLEDSAYGLAADEVTMLLALHDRDYPEHSYMDVNSGDYQLTADGQTVASFTPRYALTAEDYLLYKEILCSTKNTAMMNLKNQRKTPEECKGWYKDAGLTDGFMAYVDSGVPSERLLVYAVLHQSDLLLGDCPQDGSDCIYSLYEEKTNGQTTEYQISTGRMSAVGRAKLAQYMLNGYGIEAFLVKAADSEVAQVRLAVAVDGAWYYAAGDYPYPLRSLTKTEKTVALERLVTLPSSEDTEMAYEAAQGAEKGSMVKFVIIGVAAVAVVAVIATPKKKKAAD